MTSSPLRRSPRLSNMAENDTLNNEDLDETIISGPMAPKLRLHQVFTSAF